MHGCYPKQLPFAASVIAAAIAVERVYAMDFLRGGGARVYIVSDLAPPRLSGATWLAGRSWVLLDSNYDIYLYRQGVLRTASEPYRPGDWDDVTSHLTNHCIQVITAS